MSGVKIAASTGLLFGHRAFRKLETSRDAWTFQLNQLKRNGFTHLDLSELWLPMADLTDTQVDDLSEVIETVGLNVVGVSIVDIDLLSPERIQANTEKVLAALDVTSRLGGEFLSLGFHAIPKGGASDRFTHEPIERYQQIGAELRSAAKVATQAGIELSLEMFENGVLDRADHVLAVIEAAEPERVGANPDLGNLLRAPWSLPEYWEVTVDKLATKINYWHVKNGLRIPLPDDQAAHHVTSLPTGTMDYRSILRAALSHGFDGPLVIEHYGGDAIAQAAVGREYLDRLLADLDSTTPE